MQRKQKVALVAGSVIAIGTGLALAAHLPRRSGTQVNACATAPYAVYLVADSLHVDLVMPVENPAFDWRTIVSLESIGRDPGGEYRYLKFGWGDRDFYRNTPSLDQVQIHRLLRTLFMPGNPTAVHINGYDELPQDAGHETKCVGLTRSQYLRLVTYVRQSFRDGKLDRIQDGFVATAGFYEGSGYYSIAHTCNNWEADGLDAADVTTPLWAGLARPVMGKL